MVAFRCCQGVGTLEDRLQNVFFTRFPFLFYQLFRFLRGTLFRVFCYGLLVLLSPFCHLSDVSIGGTHICNALDWNFPRGPEPWLSALIVSNSVAFGAENCTYGSLQPPVRTTSCNLGVCVCVCVICHRSRL